MPLNLDHVIFCCMKSHRSFIYITQNKLSGCWEWFGQSFLEHGEFGDIQPHPRVYIISWHNEIILALVLHLYFVLESHVFGE